MRFIVNQLITDVVDAQTYVEKMRNGQEAAMSELKDNGMDLIKLPFYEYELSGVYGLRVLGTEIEKQLASK